MTETTSCRSPRLAPDMPLSRHPAQHLRSILQARCLKRSFPFLLLHEIPRVQLSRPQSTFGPVFSETRGLRLQSSAWCARLSRAPTTMPHPTPHKGIRVSLSSRLPTSHPPSHPS